MKTKAVYTLPGTGVSRFEAAGRDQSCEEGIYLISGPRLVSLQPVYKGRNMPLRKVSLNSTGCCFGKKSNAGKLRGFLKADVIATSQQ